MLEYIIVLFYTIYLLLIGQGDLKTINLEFDKKPDVFER